MDKDSVKEELIRAIQNRKSQRSLGDLMAELKDKYVIIYGAGFAGKFIFNTLKDYSIDTQAFLDVRAKAGESLFGVPVYQPNEPLTLQQNSSVVIVCVLCEKEEHEQIMQNLKSYGYENVISCQEKALSFRGIGDSKSQILNYDFYNSKKEKILKCTDLWDDEVSLRTFKNNAKAYILRELGEVEKRVAHKQYFLPDINFPKGYSRFIDCGAYDGDTIRDLVSLKGKVDALVLFEPSMYSFKNLNEYINSNISYIANKIILYPCGVWSKTEMQKFNAEEGSSCSISGNGNTYIQCVAIDEVLKGFAPTFIKMDIEGAEYEALLGAKKTVEQYRPDLAISVYHYVNHLWDIPLLIDSWNLGYKFYLRTYWTCGHETVMYAVSGE